MIDIVHYCNNTPWGEELNIRLTEFTTWNEPHKAVMSFVTIHIPTKSDITNPEFRKTLNNELRGCLHA